MPTTEAQRIDLERTNCEGWHLLNIAGPFCLSRRDSCCAKYFYRLISFDFMSTRTWEPMG